MHRDKFLALLKPHGTFRCQLDRRRFNTKGKPHHKQQSNAAWHLYYGHCRNGVSHTCDFLLKPTPHTDVLYFWKRIMKDGNMIRIRGSSPMNMAGRGRPWTKAKAGSRSKARRRS